MKYCKKCHILYSGYAAACPKCGADKAAAEAKDARAESEPDKKTVRRDWLWLVIGIPALIVVMYLIVLLTKLAG